jgi:hypothetical protein
MNKYSVEISKELLQASREKRIKILGPNKIKILKKKSKSPV